MRISWKTLLLVFLSILWVGFMLGPHSVHAQSARVYIDPSVTSNLSPDAKFSISVSADLGAGDSINAFDFKLRYNATVLDALSMSFDNNIFFNREAEVLAACVDIFSQPPYGGVCEEPAPGVVEGQQVVLGSPVSGPLSGALLFRVDFNVTRRGTSLFDTSFHATDHQLLLGANLVPHNLEVGVFGNELPVAFFNYSPSITVTGSTIHFDGSKSFDPQAPVAAQNGISFYEWDFRDGSPRDSGADRAVVSHVFNVPFPFKVRLSVKNPNGDTGTLERTVGIVRPVASFTLLVRDATGPVGGASVEVVDVATGEVAARSTTHPNGTVAFQNLRADPVRSYRVVVSGRDIETHEEILTIVADQPVGFQIFVTRIPRPSVDPLILLLGSTAAVVGGVMGLVLFSRRRKRSKLRKR